MFPVKLRRPRRSVGVAVIKPHHAETFRPRRPVGFDQIARINLKPIAWRIVPRIRRRNRSHYADFFAVSTAHEKPAAFMRVIGGGMSANGSVLFSCDLERHKLISLSHDAKQIPHGRLRLSKFTPLYIVGYALYIVAMELELIYDLPVYDEDAWALCGKRIMSCRFGVIGCST